MSYFISDGLDGYIGVASMQVNYLTTRNFPKHFQKSLKVLLKKSYLGQAHHMFSRFLNLRICDFFHEFFFVLFFYGVEVFYCVKKCRYYCLLIITEKDKLQPSKKLKNEMLWQKIRGFVDSEFVKTCDELVISLSGEPSEVVERLKPHYG